ncbi:MAG: hydroxymethylpyrimidine/phosphomethylpyrimidine kinase, partial [Magnetococcales bacterium]|nr:hydroxymethylpyrimidine/phosphomethylpyrimidine kinase [Magnetococcales bacterium]
MDDKPRLARLLIVAGSDPVAGAGMQADLKVATGMGVYGMTAVTAITIQDTARVVRVEPLSAELVAQQMRVCLADVGADAIKLGMLATGEIVRAVVGVLRDHPGIPVVADPVLAGTGGGMLLESGALESYRELLIPLVTLLTPNLPEAAALTALPVATPEQMVMAGVRLRELGARAVLVKGGHLEGEGVMDWLAYGTGSRFWHGERLVGSGFHGTGCVLA